MILGLWKERRSSIASSFASTSNASAPTSKAALVSKGKKKDIEEIFEDSETEPESDDEVQVVEPVASGWLYVGSHNFTPSAWYVVTHFALQILLRAATGAISPEHLLLPS